MADLVLLLQGGLGNQLLQLVLAESLAQASTDRLVASTVLLESRSRRLRGLTRRCLSPLVMERLLLKPEPWHRYAVPRLAARFGSPLMVKVLTDRFLVETAPVSSLLDQLGWVRLIHTHATHPALFGEEFQTSWLTTLESLRSYGLTSPVQVALHVRRADYLNPRSGFIALGEAYYRSALAHGLATLPGGAPPTAVHVCTDDPEWCRMHLQNPAWRLVFTAGTPEQDLATMAHARILITSNSSLSAIAGHLAQLRDPRTLVITPGRWLLNPNGRLGDLRKPAWHVVLA